MLPSTIEFLKLAFIFARRNSIYLAIKSHRTQNNLPRRRRANTEHRTLNPEP